MNNKVNRKSEDEDSEMLREVDNITKKIIQTLKKKYGFSDQHIHTEFGDSGERADIAIILNEEQNKPEIIAEIKTGKIVFPFATYQLEKIMKFFNAEYGLITNGKDWYYYQFVEDVLTRIGDIPSFNTLSDNENEIKVKKFSQFTDVKHVLRNLKDDLRNYPEPHEAFLQLILYKLFDENYEKNKNFKQISQLPKTHSKIFETLWQKTNKKFPDLFSSNFIKEFNIHSIPTLVEFSNSSLTKSDPNDVIQIIINEYYGNFGHKGGFIGAPKELIEFVDTLTNFQQKDRILIPYCGPEITAYLLSLISDKYSKKFNGKIVVIEPNYQKITFLRIISELKIPKFEIIHGDPVLPSILEDFRESDHIFSIPPFGMKLSKSDINENFADYGSDGINYFLKRLISTFASHTRFAVIVPQSFLFRGSKHSKQIRNEILESCTLKAIISLPPKLFSSVQIPSSLLLFETGLSEKINSEIFMGVVSESFKDYSESNKSFSELIDSYRKFIKGEIIKNPSKLGFVVSAKEMEDSWTVQDKIPEMEIFDIPYKQRLGDAVEIISGASTPLKKFKEGKEFQFLRISDFSSGKLKLDGIKKVQLDNETAKRYKKFQLKKDDIVISSKGTVGKILYIEKDYENLIATSQLLIIRSNQKKIIPKYLFDILNSNLVKNQIYGLSSSATIQSISKIQLSRVIISVPPLSKQRDKIEKSTIISNEIAELEEHLASLKEKLQGIRDND